MFSRDKYLCTEWYHFCVSWVKNRTVSQIVSDDKCRGIIIVFEIDHLKFNHDT